MNIRIKILINCLVPLLLIVSYFVGGYYYFRQQSLFENSGRRITTRLNDAMTVITKHANVIQKYGLTGISASLVKAKLDAMEELSQIKIGDSGFIFITDRQGVVVLHPDKYFTGADVSSEQWFIKIAVRPRDNNGNTSSPKKLLALKIRDKNYLAQHLLYEPWDWYIVGVEAPKSLWQSIEHHLLGFVLPGIFLVFSCIWFIYYRINKLTGPLGYFTDQLEKMSSDSADEGLLLPEFSEYAALSQAINRFIRTKENQIQTLTSENSFLSVFSKYSVDLITVIDPNKKLIYVNASVERVLGRNPIEMVGRRLTEFLEPDDTAQFDEHLRLAELSNISAPPVEIRLKHQDGRWCTLEAISRRLPRSSGSSRGFVTFSRNVDRRIYAQEVADRSHAQLRDKFEKMLHQVDVLNIRLENEIQARLDAQAAGNDLRRSTAGLMEKIIADMKKDLTAVFGFNGIADAALMDKPMQAFLGTARQSAENILQYANDMALFNGLLFQDIAPKNGHIDLRQVFELLAQKYKSHLIKKPVVLLCDIDPFFPECIVTDPDFLPHILHSLMDLAFNSIASGHIRLAARPDPRPDDPQKIDLNIRIEMNNHKIPESLFAKLAACCENAPAGCDWPEYGLDLSLFNSCHLINRMGGKMQIEQTGPDTACFDLIFPEIKISRQKVSDDSLIDVSTFNFKDAVVLIIDAHSPANLTLTRLLEQFKITVLSCETDNQMEQIIETHPPDLVFADFDHVTNPEKFNLPRVQHLLRPGKLTVIGMTTNILNARAAESESSHFREMICMPFRLAQLHALIGKYIKTDPSAENWEPDISLTDLILRDKCRADAEFKKVFNDQLMPGMPEYRQGINISQIESYALKLIRNGDKFDLSEMIRLGEMVASLSASFDIEKIKICLETIEALFNRVQKPA